MKYDPQNAAAGELWTTDGGSLYLVVAPQSIEYREGDHGSPDILVERIASPSNPIGWGGVRSYNPAGLDAYVCDLDAFERVHGELSISDEAADLLDEHGFDR